MRGKSSSWFYPVEHTGIRNERCIKAPNSHSEFAKTLISFPLPGAENEMNDDAGAAASKLIIYLRSPKNAHNLIRNVEWYSLPLKQAALRDDVKICPRVFANVSRTPMILFYFSRTIDSCLSVNPGIDSVSEKDYDFYGEDCRMCLLIIHLRNSKTIKVVHPTIESIIRKTIDKILHPNF